MRECGFPRCPHNSCGSEVMAGWTQPEAPTFSTMELLGRSEYGWSLGSGMSQAFAQCGMRKGGSWETGNGRDNGRRMMNGTSGT